MFLGIEKYKKYNDLSGVGAERIVNDTRLNTQKVQVSGDFKVEPVEKFVSKVGERVIEGSNNAVIRLGQDGDSPKEKSGIIDIVAGRNGARIDLENDKSRVYISENSDVDSDYKIQIGNKKSGPCVLVKSDEIRIIARKETKIIVDDGDMTVDAKNINIGKDAQDFVAQVNKIKAELSRMAAIFDAHTQTVAPTPIGLAASPPTTPMSPIGELGSKTVKVKD